VENGEWWSVVAFRAKFNSYIDIQSVEMLGRVEASERVCECNQLKRCAHPFIYSFIQSFILNRSLVSQSVRQPRQSFSQLRDSLFPLSLPTGFPIPIFISISNANARPRPHPHPHPHPRRRPRTQSPALSAVGQEEQCFL